MKTNTPPTMNEATDKMFPDLVETGELKKNPWGAWEDKCDPLIPTATFQIYDFIGAYLGKRSDKNINRASSATYCPKRRWYQKQGFEPTPLTPRKLINFLIGDLGEKTMQYFIIAGLVGEGKLYSEVNFGKEIGSFTIQGKKIGVYEQEDLEAEIEGIRVTAHGDGFGKRNSDGKWELIECKTAANWGFKNFQTDGELDYIKQVHTVMLTTKAKELGVTECRFFFLKKETGHLWDRLYKFDPEVEKEIRKELLIANGEKEPATPYKLIAEMTGRKPNKVPTGRKIAEFPCSYCGYLEKCQGKFTLEWKEDQWGNLKPLQVFGEKVDFKKAAEGF